MPMGFSAWVKRRLRILFRRDDVESDLSDEIRLHIDMETEELARQGRTGAEAQREARILLGGVEQTKEAVREVRPLQWLDGIGLDVKLGLRMLRKSWGLTLVGGLAMVVVIGLCTTGFVFLEAVTGMELPLEEGDRVVALRARDRVNGFATSLQHFERWRQTMRSVEDLAVFQTIESQLTTDDGWPARVAVARMTASGFRVARVAPLLGRPLLAEDERAGAKPAVVVIGYDVWQSRLASDPAAVGRTVRLGGLEHVVVGVMPKEFVFPGNNQAWVPFQSDPLMNAAAQGVSVFGRLASGIALESARAELASIGAEGPGVSGEKSGPLRTNVTPFGIPFQDPKPGAWLFRVLPLLFALLLIPPCANIAILIYARNVMRTQEFAARFVLGAGRRRIVGQLLIEAMVLAAGASGVALVVTQQFLQWFTRDEEFTRGMSYWILKRMSLSFESVLYAVGLALFAALVAGGLPALRATGRMAQSGFQALGHRTGGPRLSRTWGALVAAQVALSMAVLPAAIDIAWGALSPTLRGPGFASEEYLTARVVLDEEPRAGTRFRDLQLELIRQVNARTGISGVTVSASVHGMGTGSRIEADVARQEPFGARFNVVDESFFEVFENRLLSGRRFEAGDFSPGNPVVIVNRSFANALVGAPNPLGVRVRRNSAENGGDTEAGPWFEIVGVVDDLLLDPLPRIYYAMQPATVTGRNNAVSLTLRVGRTIPPDLAGRLQGIAAALEPSLRIDQIRTLDDVFWEANRDEKFAALGLTTVVLIVLLFSVAGIYTLGAFAVTQRRHEIAIRSALGAQPRRLIGDLFLRSLAPVLGGAAVGLALALLIGIWVERLSVIALAGSAGFMILVGLLAVSGPARRALRVEATEALRES